VPSVAHLATLELACHAGGREFESRRSRKVPAKSYVLLSVWAQTIAGLFHPAHIPLGNLRREPRKAADSRNP
jgi:hypothetical protein